MSAGLSTGKNSPKYRSISGDRPSNTPIRAKIIELFFLPNLRVAMGAMGSAMQAAIK